MQPRHRIFVVLTASLFLLALSAHASDCAMSKPFEVRHEQVLSGELRDLMGAVAPGMRIALISDKNKVKYITTDESGHYDFGILTPGTYRIRMKDAGHGYCAPDVNCDSGSCKLVERLTRNAQHPDPAPK
jgi:hypothetical protein